MEDQHKISQYKLIPNEVTAHKLPKKLGKIRNFFKNFISHDSQKSAIKFCQDVCLYKRPLLWNLVSRPASQNSGLVILTFKGRYNFKWMPLKEVYYKFHKIGMTLICTEK